MPFSAEPETVLAEHGRIAVVMVNLGTPASPKAADIRSFLREFLSDRRVVEIPRLLWLPILYGAILPLRPRATASKYAAIWTEQGSPLMVYSRQQAQLLRGYLGDRWANVDVALAMRYGEPSIATVMRHLQARSVAHVLVLPMYPQYSASTTASVFDEVCKQFTAMRDVPELRCIKDFHDDGGYIEALRKSVLDHWKKNGRLDDGDKLVISFHGVPKRTVELGDPYYRQCQRTGELVAQSLGLRADDYVITFQSRFGRAEWLQPYTAPTLGALAEKGVKRVDLICPGFVTDCLETLEEIAIEAKGEFLGAGGREFRYIRCLNDSSAFIAALAELAQRHLQGWPVKRRAVAVTQRAAR